MADKETIKQLLTEYVRQNPNLVVSHILDSAYDHLSTKTEVTNEDLAHELGVQLSKCKRHLGFTFSEI